MSNELYIIAAARVTVDLEFQEVTATVAAIETSLLNAANPSLITQIVNGTIVELDIAPTHSWTFARPTRVISLAYHRYSETAV